MLVFLFHYVVSIVKCPFPLSLFFVSSSQPLLLSFFIIIREGMSKEKVEKMLKGQSSKKVE